MERDGEHPLKFCYNAAYASYFFNNDWKYILQRSEWQLLADDICRQEVCQEQQDISLTTEELRCTTHPLMTNSIVVNKVLNNTVDKKCHLL